MVVAKGNFGTISTLGTIGSDKKQGNINVVGSVDEVVLDKKGTTVDRRGILDPLNYLKVKIMDIY